MLKGEHRVFNEGERLLRAPPAPPEPAEVATQATGTRRPDTGSGVRARLDAPSVIRLQASLGNRATAGLVRGNGRTLHRKRFDDAAVRAKAGDVARTDDRGSLGNYVEAKARLRAEEIFGDTGSTDSDRNYFQAKGEVDRAWQQYEQLSNGADPGSLDWPLMENGLSTDEFRQAVVICRDAFVATLAASRDLAGALAGLRQRHGAIPALAAAVDEAETTTRARKQATEQFNQASATATAGLLDPLKVMTSIAELAEFCEHVARRHGISPLDSVEDFVNNATLNLPLQAATTPLERTGKIKEVQARWDPAVAGAGGTEIPARPIDAQGRLRPDQKPNVGPQAHHAETIHVEGDRQRQLVLGVGRPGDPQGYQDFAKDYGMWDYESWGAWNKQSAKFPVAQQIDPNNGADVDTVLGAQDVSGRAIFEKLHFRLTGVFPTISGVKEKLLAALALYNEKFGRADDYHGSSINPLWTLGEICTIVGSPQLAAKTSFYGDQPDEYVAKLADILPAQVTDLQQLFMPKMTMYQQIGEQLATEIKATYVGPQRRAALKRVADTYYNIPRGYDWLIADVHRHVASLPAPQTNVPVASTNVPVASTATTVI